LATLPPFCRSLQKGFFPMPGKYAIPPKLENPNRQWPEQHISISPSWCAVDLRDGNQALPNPMTPVQKKRYFQILVDIGFKQIEIGFPSASADDFQFCRDLIEENLIPADVTISVLTQAREHLIRRTFEALRGVKRAIVHVYIASSDLHMHFVFGKTRQQTLQTTIDAIELIRQQAQAMTDSEIDLEFSPEEFTDTDLDFAVELCDQVVESWIRHANDKVILNLPATVERRMPFEYGDMIEIFRRKLRHLDNSIISVHAHNDMGTAVAATEMAVQAGADRVEGTLFGHGERCGNVDLVTMALNLQYLGCDTGLDFHNLEQIRDELVELTDMPVHARHPYAGELVFTAFSGSHQDAIHKGLNRRDELVKAFGSWKIPYLHIDPKDIGRSYENFIRINSQSGKGGIAHILQQEYGVRLPRPLLIEFSATVQAYVDSKAREINAAEVWQLFRSQYCREQHPLQLLNYWPRPNDDQPSLIEGEVHVRFAGTMHILQSTASGPIAAFVHAIQQLPIPEFRLEEFEEDAIGSTAEAEAITFVRLCRKHDGANEYGVGFAANIDQAAVLAIVSALNALLDS